MRRLVFTVYFDILINWKFYCIINILLSILIFSFACSNKTTNPLEEVLAYPKMASAMCPVKFMPLYQLTELYLKTERKEDALILAQKIVDKEVKVSSPIISISIKCKKYWMTQIV